MGGLWGMWGGGGGGWRERERERERESGKHERESSFSCEKISFKIFAKSYEFCIKFGLQVKFTIRGNIIRLRS